MNKTKKIRIKDVNTMLPFLQIPKTPTESLHDKAKVIHAEPKMTDDQIKAREGTYFDEKDMTIYDNDVDIYDANTKKTSSPFP